MSSSASHLTDTELQAVAFDGASAEQEVHLRACAECSRKVEGYRSLDEALVSLPLPAADETFVSQVMAKVDSGAEEALAVEVSEAETVEGADVAGSHGPRASRSQVPAVEVRAAKTAEDMGAAARHGPRASRSQAPDVEARAAKTAEGMGAAARHRPRASRSKTSARAPGAGDGRLWLGAALAGALALVLAATGSGPADVLSVVASLPSTVADFLQVGLVVRALASAVPALAVLIVLLQAVTLLLVMYGLSLFTHPPLASEEVVR